MPEVVINFIGPWKVFLGANSVKVNVKDMAEAREYVESNFGPVYEKKLKSMGAFRKQSIWDNSNILLNGNNIARLENVSLKKDDKLDVIPRVAGG